MIRRRLLTKGPADPPGFDRAACPSSPTDLYISYDGSRFHCQAVSSANGSWELLFGRRADGDRSRWFRFRQDELVDTRHVSRPVDGAIADDGTAIVVSAGDPATLGGELTVLGDDGIVLSRQFDRSLGRPVVRPDGDVCAISTRPPEPTVYGCCLRTETWILERTFRERTIRLLGFHADGDESYCYVGVRSAGDPYLALDEEGEVAWESDRHWATRSLADRVGSFVDSIRLGA
ncbi:hypothetical protein D8Y22_19625 [Salinadaptatus halalkaliphilus]|uniref:Uncharacterized protein n=1 Tax=Salinadaptatus halalkaliphilus TaxID=2419781 RepID=A0A4V3VKV7_9EURY|nr:hypothetical protein [Salinadaptatus halalkaliphilus]THE63197.1 hypothetical protein D8Y22_19625 [Salinadaptatus halalkaliphilus]